MRSGASWACSCAMRQLLSSLPPRMVSRKCTFQLSSGQTLPMAAAAPPSAMTVWALPSRDLHTSAVRSPRSLASMAARMPAPPAPITTTSKSCVSISSMVGIRFPDSEELGVMEGPAGDEPDVEVGKGHHEEAGPGELHVPGVQGAEEFPHPVADGVRGELVHVATAQVPAGVARGRVQPQEN